MKVYRKCFDRPVGPEYNKVYIWNSGYPECTEENPFPGFHWEVVDLEQAIKDLQNHRTWVMSDTPYDYKDLNELTIVCDEGRRGDD